jgi:excisionase family DNA binding protein
VTTSPYLKEKEAAEYLNLEHQTLTRWRWASKGPKFYKIGKRGSIRYRREDLEAYIEAGART